MSLPQHTITPLAKPVKWTVTVPGSKSLMNRAVLCAALAKGKSVLRDPMYCDDTNYLIRALTTLGVRFKKQHGQLVIYGTGGVWKKPSRPLQVGNAGTTLRFLVPQLPVGATITGNERMRQRPMADLMDALTELGFHLECPTGCPPVKMLRRTVSAKIIHVRGNISSQYLSALLMLAPTLPHGLHIQLQGQLVSAPYIDMTLAVMRAFGITVRRPSPTSFVIAPQRYLPTTHTIEGDVSSATYWWALAAISRSKITVTNINPNTLQPDILFLKYLKRMGCTVTGTTVVGPWAGPHELRGITVNMSSSPDAVMSLAVVAALARGRTTITGVHHLVAKESNRLQALQLNLRRLGISARATSASLTIVGRQQKLWSETIQTYGDHRLAMAFAILGLVHPGIRVTEPDCVRKSYPQFWRHLAAVQRQAKNQTILLTGMRGSGKTTLARRLIQQFHSRGFDTDIAVLSDEPGCESIADIVEGYGWPYFRLAEHEVIKASAHVRNTVIATGGGTVLPKKNFELIKHHYIILLTAPVSVLRQRLQREPNYTQRPSLTGQVSSSVELDTIWRQRKRRYFEIADTVYDTRG